MQVSLDREGIEARIPHRAPFLWIDEVLAMDDTSIHARKFVDPQLDVFRGHYPEFPMLPGVLQCEMCFQAAAILIADIEPVTNGEVPVVTRQSDTKFRRMVRPGETIDIHVEITDRLANAFYLSGKTSVDGQVATRLSFACASAPKPDA